MRTTMTMTFIDIPGKARETPDEKLASPQAIDNRIEQIRNCLLAKTPKAFKRLQALKELKRKMTGEAAPERIDSSLLATKSQVDEFASVLSDFQSPPPVAKDPGSERKDDLYKNFNG